MWITSCTGMQHSTRGHSLNGLRTCQREFPAPCRADGSFDVSVVTRKLLTCDLAEERHARVVESSSGDSVILGPCEWLQYQCSEGHTASGTAGTRQLFAVKRKDVLHAMSQCRPVECGGAPASACATAEHVSGHVFTYEEKVSFSCQTGYQVGLNRSRKTFQLRIVFKSRFRVHGSSLMGRLPVPRSIVSVATACEALAVHFQGSVDTLDAPGFLIWSPRSLGRAIMLASALDLERAFSYCRAELHLQR